jgi:pimeloyl-ACP methyl ester carboxylesterase
MNRSVTVEVFGSPADPTLIYLPGLHGDCTLIRRFRESVQNRVRVVQVGYPRAVEWSLQDYAASILHELSIAGIREGWILAESFGSQVGWALEAAAASGTRDGRVDFKPLGFVLAGGCVRYPFATRQVVGSPFFRVLIPFAMRTALRFYPWYARLRHWKDPRNNADIAAFVAERRMPFDREVLEARLQLIAEADFRERIARLACPVYQLTGFIDPIVPWSPVRSWLRQNCPAWKETLILYRADHNVLNTQALRSRDAILRWIGVSR